MPPTWILSPIFHRDALILIVCGTLRVGDACLGVGEGKEKGIRNGNGVGNQVVRFLFYPSCEKCVGFNWRKYVGQT